MKPFLNYVISELYGCTENRGVDHKWGWKAQEWKTREESARVENTGMQNVGGDCRVEITEVETRRRRMHGRKTEEDLLWKAKYGVNA